MPIAPEADAEAKTAVWAQDRLITPFLSVDRERIRSAYAALVNALPEAAIHYAMKALPERQVLSAIMDLEEGRRRLAASRTAPGAKAASYGGFEIASEGELAQLRNLGVPGAEILYSNPVKPLSQIAAASAAGVWRFAFDSTAELDKLAMAAPASAVYVRLATRDSTSVVNSEGKFGVNPRQAVSLMLDAKERGLSPHGIAFHVGSQTLKPGAWEAAIYRAWSVMGDLASRGIRVEMLNLGGGFPARYAEPDQVPPIASITERIRCAVATLPFPVDLVVEPGRFLVAEAGTMVATVIGVAERGDGIRWVHLDVGAFNGFMEALETGNRLTYPVSDSRGQKVKRRCHLTGPSCDFQDTILFNVDLSVDIQTGDHIYIGSSSAYTIPYASGFNGFATVFALHM